MQQSPSHESVTVAGLKDSVEIVIDHWGVPHIRAQNEQDLFFAQGFNAARDRLWQLDVWRKRGLGLLAADFGPGYLAQDYASRLFLYRGDMEQEWAAYGPDAEEICRAFTMGINAYIELTRRDPSRLPPEFTLMQTKPSAWSPADLVRIRSHGLTRNALSEILRANVLAQADQATDTLRQLLEPATIPIHSPDVDLASVPLDVLTLFKLAGATVTFESARLQATPAEAWHWTKVNELGEVMVDQTMTGSNNWVIAPEKSATGRPIMANDPHRAHSLPGLRYLVHLSAPGLDVIGAGEPVIPGISIGHNGTAAFGLTIFYSDQEDVYIYQAHPDNPDLYRYEDGWEPVEIVEHQFGVRGYETQTLPLRFTRHGPILHEDAQTNRLYAVRSVWFEPGTAPYMRSLVSMRAKTLPAYRQAMRAWHVPSVNHVYADTTGAIAWVPSGMTPVRKGWNGLLPVPGDGRFEWQGFLDHDLLPIRINPPEGFIATANAMNLPKDYPHEVGYEWIEPSRADRIHQVLQGQSKHGLDESCALQVDTVSMPALRMQSLLRALAKRITANGPEEQSAFALLLNWNGDLNANSGPAALFEVWWSKHLKPMLLRRLVPQAKVRSLLVPGHVESLLRALEAPGSRFGPDPGIARDELLRVTLVEAWRDCIAHLGKDAAQWRWGRLHHAYFEHGLSGFAQAEDRPVLDIGPFPHGGSSSTPMHTGYRLPDFRTTHGASVRLVVDVGSWDESRWINAPGQSGDPRSIHYRDLASIWAQGDYVPMLYSREAVDAAATQIITLHPYQDSELPL